MALARLLRLARIARRELWQRRLPHGLLGWRYLWPGQDARIRYHRQLWWANGAHWPRPLWLLVQAWQWLRWVLWGAWRSTWRVVRRLGPEVSAREGISQRRQFIRVLRLALGWCIPPGDAYRFGLVQAPTRALDYVYDQELPAYHHWRSTPLGLKPESLALLGDKLALADQLSTLGLPLVSTHRCLAQSDPELPLSEALQGLEQAFCKRRHGNQGEGAFSVWRSAQGLTGRAFSGRLLAEPAALEQAWRQLRALDDVLIQPRLANHPRLAPLAVGEEAITVRCITQWRETGEPGVLSAVLEVPVGWDEHTQHTRYGLLPIAPETGRLQPWPRPEQLPQAAQTALAALWQRVPNDLSLPDWSALVAFSLQAQRRFPDVWAIAWDWVLTADDPVLLEGNSGWGTAVPQQLQGGWLAHAAANALLRSIKGC